MRQGEDGSGCREEDPLSGWVRRQIMLPNRVLDPNTWIPKTKLRIMVHRFAEWYH